MPLLCPLCQKSIRVSSVRSSFACPACAKGIYSNYRRVLSWLIPLCVLAEAIVFWLLYQATDSLLVTFYAYGYVFPLSGFILYWFGVRSFVKFSCASVTAGESISNMPQAPSD